MASLALVRAQVESRIPGALTIYQRPAHRTLPTGIVALDNEIGGLPQNALTQVCAPLESSSGKTTLLVSALAQATQRGECVALIDAGDCFDPASAKAAGVELPRVLWVRCGENRCAENQVMRPLEQALKAADILLQNGGFRLLAIDLGNVEARFVRKVPLTTWFRFARVVEKRPIALLLLSALPVAQSCAALTLQLHCQGAGWQRSEMLSHAQLLAGIDFEMEIARSSARKPMHSVRPKFTARSQWM